jgi:hypothetical protein
VGEVVGVISLVGDRGLGLDAVDQVMNESDVVALAGRGDQANRKAESLCSGVDRGAQAAAKPTQALGMPIGVPASHVIGSFRI